MVDLSLRTPFRTAIYQYIAQHPGSTMAQIVNYVYSNVRDGGAMWTSSSVTEAIAKINQELAPHNLQIRTRRGQGATYKVVKLKERLHDTP